MHLTQTFQPLLQEFLAAFTAPSFRTFCALMAGWLLTFRHRFVTELILSCGSAGDGHHGRFHRFFSGAAWSVGKLWQLLARLLVRRFAAHGVIELAIDDTLCRKRGLGLFGAGMHHDPLLSSRALKVCSWGHDWVVLFVLIRRWWAPGKVWALPISCRLYTNRQGLTKGKRRRHKGKGNKARRRPAPTPAAPGHRTRPELAVEMIREVAAWFPDRKFLASGDSAYGGKSVLSPLPANVDLISRVAPNGGLYAPAPEPAPGVRPAGRPRKKGARLPGMQEWAADETPWRRLTFDRFGLHATVEVKEQKALYYKAGKDRKLSVVLVRDVGGKRPLQMFYCTRLDWEAKAILSKYAARWAAEVTFEDCKQLLGFADPANRKPLAVRRTAPCALVLYSLVVLWCDQAGHQWLRWPQRPWYPHKRRPSFADLLGALRRRSWEEYLAGVLPESALREKGLAVLIDFVSRAG
jgi:hypothetical protein